MKLLHDKDFVVYGYALIWILSNWACFTFFDRVYLAISNLVFVLGTVVLIIIDNMTNWFRRH